MKFMTVREMRGGGAALWRELPEEKEVVITSNGRPVAIMTSVDGQDFEQSLADIRRARAMRAATAMQEASVRRGTDRMTMAEIDAVIADVRKKRHAHRL